MKEIVIIGARAFGIEICNLARHCLGYNEDWTIKGFLDDDNVMSDRLPYPILSTVLDYTIETNDVFICALGNVQSKKKYISLIKEKGGSFHNLISKNAIIDTTFVNKEGLIIASFCTVSNNVSMGNYVTLHGFVTIGHDCEIGDYSHLGTYSFMGGAAKIKDCVQMNTRATLIPNITVGSNAVIGAGAVVFRNVAASVTVIGNPATILKF